MAYEEQLAILQQGVDVWNAWRKEHPQVTPDLRGVDLHGAKLRNANLLGADLHAAKLAGADLQGALLGEANLYFADLRGADLTEAILIRTDLGEADLDGANLMRASLHGADLQSADFRGADLTNADLTEAMLVHTNLDHAILTGCTVYGLSVWDIRGTPKDQASLIITPRGAPTITVDDLEVAQFIYLLLNREKLRNVINTITSKAVLILGRFTPERKLVLDAMADEVRKHNLLAIIFDFERVTTQDFTETIKTLAGLSLFVIADITNPRSAPLELQATVPDYHIPFIPIIQQGEDPFSMFRDLSIYPWMLNPPIAYASVEELLEFFEEGILAPAWEKHQQLIEQKGKAVKSQSIKDFVRSRRGEVKR
jgi:uncharacterized protein YjbI with pentapeptide repeats